MKNHKRVNLLYQILMALFYIMFCLCMAFTSRLLQANGFTYVETANAVMLSSICGFAMQFLWGNLNDRGLSPRVILTIASIFSIVSFYFFTHYGQSYLVSVVSLIAASVGIASMMSLIDAWGVKLIGQGIPIKYPKARSFGSLTYALTSVAFGVLLDIVGMRVTPWFLLVTFIPSFIVMMLMPVPKQSTEAAEKENFFKSVGILRKHPTYKHYLLAMFVSGLGISAQLLFYPAFMLEIGATNSQIGFGFAVMAFSEVLVMPFYGRLKTRFGVRNIFILSVIGHGVRVLVVALAINPVFGILGMLTQTIAGALLFPSIAAYVSDEVDPRVISTAQVLLTAMFFTLAGVVSNLMSGQMAMAIGVRRTLLILSATPFAAGIYLMLMTRKSKGGNTNDRTA